MRSVLLVDDEYFIRVRAQMRGLAGAWHDMVADCESGREALSC